MNGRGQSEVIGVVLIFGLVIAGTTGIVVFGSQAVSDTKGVATSQAAEHAMTQLDSKASLVAHGESDSQRARLPGRSTSERRVEPDRGWMNVTIRDRQGNVTAVLMNVTLGAVVYEDGDDTIAYQGGGVWRKRGDGGSTMVSPPEFHYRGTTLTLPLVVVDGEGSLNERVRVGRTGSEQGVYPNASEGRSNPLTKGTVVVEVHSEYYDAWGRFFSERTGGSADIDHGNETATIKLLTPAQTDPVSAGLSSTAAGDEIELSGAGDNGAFVDSYNSTGGDYNSTKSDNGTVLTSGSIDMSGNSRIEGNIRSGGSVGMSGSANVTGHVEWTTGFSAGGNTEYGSEEQIDGVAEAEDISSFVIARLDRIEGDNDNANTTAIESDRLNFTDSTATLDVADGPRDRFYLSEVDMDGSRELIVQTNGEEVEIAIGEDFQLDGAEVRVEGNGTVRFYVADDVAFDDGTNVTVPGEQSQRLWLYGTPDTDISMEGSSGNPIRFVGVVYATGDSDDNDFDIGHADIYGGVIAGEMDVGTGGAVHYDESLQNVQPLPEGSDLPKVTYLHVSVTEVEVEND